MLKYQFALPTEEDTVHIGQYLAACCVADFVIVVNGELGAGKTTLIRSVLQSLGVTSSIKSPTYNLVEEYNVNNLIVYHFDLYRFNTAEEWLDLGFNEYLTQQALCFIEWGENAVQYLTAVDWEIQFTMINNLRHMQISAVSDKGFPCLKQLINIVDQSSK